MSTRDVHTGSAQAPAARGGGVITVTLAGAVAACACWEGVRMRVLNAAASPGFPRNRGLPSTPTAVWLCGQRACEKPVRPVLESPWLLRLAGTCLSLAPEPASGVGAAPTLLGRPHPWKQERSPSGKQCLST